MTSSEKTYPREDIPADLQWLYASAKAGSGALQSDRQVERGDPCNASDLPVATQMLEAPIVILDETRAGLTVNCETLVAMSEESLRSICADSHYQTLWLCGALHQNRPVAQRPDYLLPPLAKSTPVGGTPTDERLGVTMWHLLALGILPEAIVVDFLRSAAEEDEATVRADLWELTGPSPSWTVLRHFRARETPSWLCWPDEVLTALTRFRSPLLLCPLGGKGFLEPYAHLLTDDLVTSPLRELQTWSAKLQLQLRSAQVPEESAHS